MENNPVVTGDFNGVENISDSIIGAGIILNMDQILNVKGAITGITRLNVKEDEYIEIFKNNHEYVIAEGNVTGDFTIKGSIYDNYELQKRVENNSTIWTAVRIDRALKELRWVGGENKIVNPRDGVYSYPIEFIDDEGESYKPNILELLNNYVYTIQKPNGDIVDSEEFTDRHVYFGIDEDKALEEDPNILNEIYIELTNSHELRGEMILNVTNIVTNHSISKTIYLLDDSDVLNGSVNIDGNIMEGRTVSADISGLPENCKELSYRWYINGVEVKGEVGKNFTLESNHVGQSIKVEVEAMNYVGTVFSSEVIVKPKDLAPVIHGVNDIEIKVSEVDEFNNAKKLEGITVTDDFDMDLEVTVIGQVGKPIAGTSEVYELIYEVKDSNNNVTREVRKVIVTNQLPSIIGLTDITITEGESFDIKVGVRANDEEDGDISKFITYPTVDLSKLSVGKHEIEYRVEDSDGNITIKKRIVNVLEKVVIPNNKPVITLKVNELIIKSGENINLLDYIESAEDIEDGDLLDRVTYKISTYDISTPGIYEVVYSVSDKDGETSTAILKLIVEENKEDSDDNDIVEPDDSESEDEDNVEPDDSESEDEDSEESDDSELDNNVTEDEDYRELGSVVIEDINNSESTNIIKEGQDNKELDDKVVETEEEKELYNDVIKVENNKESNKNEVKVEGNKETSNKKTVGKIITVTVIATGGVAGAAAAATAATGGNFSLKSILDFILRKRR